MQYGCGGVSGEMVARGSGEHVQPQSENGLECNHKANEQTIK